LRTGTWSWPSRSHREVPTLTLEEALGLLFLYAEKDPLCYEKAALRWLSMNVSKGKAVSLLKVQLVSSELAELRGVEREHAARPLTELVR
jgi:hypothetical protein